MNHSTRLKDGVFYAELKLFVIILRNEIMICLKLLACSGKFIPFRRIHFNEKDPSGQRDPIHSNEASDVNSNVNEERVSAHQRNTLLINSQAFKKKLA